MWGYRWGGYAQKWQTEKYSLIVSTRELEAIRDGLLCAQVNLKDEPIFKRLSEDALQLIVDGRVPAPDQPEGRPHV